MPTTSTMAFEALATETPVVLTSFGSRPRAIETRFCTSTAARSMLRSSSKVAVMLLRPLLPLVEVR